MPAESAKTIMDQLGAESGPPYMVPAHEADVSNLAVIHALRTAADGMKRLGEQQDRMSGKIDDIGKGVHDIDKRLAIIEGNSLNTVVKEHDARLGRLEEAEQRREGAVKLWDFVLKSWPAIAGFITLLVLLVATGKVDL